MNAMLEFDAPLGVYRSDILTDRLNSIADQVGPYFPIFAPVLIRNAEEELLSNTTSDVCKLLVYQLRALRQWFPGLRPHLRISIPLDFGRQRGVAWYDARLEPLIQEGCQLPQMLDPRKIL